MTAQFPWVPAVQQDEIPRDGVNMWRKETIFGRLESFSILA